LNTLLEKYEPSKLTFKKEEEKLQGCAIVDID